MNDKLKGVLIVIGALVALGAWGGLGNDTATSSSSSGSVGSALRSITGTTSQDNAVRSGGSYLDSSAFSRTGLIKQLKYEGYSLADATYAVDHVSVDWNEQAAKSAASYLDSSAFSRSGLMDELLYEGFTQSQASYGVSVAY